jgi:hypothetical protein
MTQPNYHIDLPTSPVTPVALYQVTIGGVARNLYPSVFTNSAGYEVGTADAPLYVTPTGASADRQAAALEEIVGLLTAPPPKKRRSTLLHGR